MRRPYAVIRRIVTPDGWYRLVEGETIMKGDLTVYGTGDVWYETHRAGETVGPGDVYIRSVKFLCPLPETPNG